MTKRKASQQPYPHDPLTGESVDAIAPRSALDILKHAPGQRLFKNDADVEAYICSERESWDRH